MRELRLKLIQMLVNPMTTSQITEALDLPYSEVFKIIDCLRNGKYIINTSKNYKGGAIYVASGKEYKLKQDEPMPGESHITVKGNVKTYHMLNRPANHNSQPLKKVKNYISGNTLSGIF